MEPTRHLPTGHAPGAAGIDRVPLHVYLLCLLTVLLPREAALVSSGPGSLALCTLGAPGQREVLIGNCRLRHLFPVPSCGDASCCDFSGAHSSFHSTSLP